MNHMNDDEITQIRGVLGTPEKTVDFEEFFDFWKELSHGEQLELRRSVRVDACPHCSGARKFSVLGLKIHVSYEQMLECQTIPYP